MTERQRVTVIVGGTSGTGWATAQLLHFQGDVVVIADADGEAAAARAAELGAPALGAAVRSDDVNDVRRLFEFVRERHDAIDSVVHCARITPPGALVEFPLAEWRITVDASVTDAYLVLREAADAMVGGGAVALVTSPRENGDSSPDTRAARSGALLLTEVAALELGSRGIRVNAVCPGVTAADEPTPGAPVDAFCDPDDVANAVAFLVSREATWMTGAALDLSAGARLQRYPNAVRRVRALTG